jgi:hypothetical protein
VSGGAGAGAARAAAALALLGLAHGAGPAAPEPASCAHPRALPGAGLLRVDCAPVAAPGGGLEGASVLLFGARLDPNRATPRALEALPGIGPARAAAIAGEARVRAFCRPADLERVPGIGPVTRQRLADWIETGAGACGE